MENQEENQVFQWLRSFQMEIYWEDFRKGGFDQFSTFTELKETDLSALLKIERQGHLRIIWKRIQQKINILTSNQQDSSQQTLIIDKNHVLGKGQFSTVYKGTFGNREVAIKEIKSGDKLAVGPEQIKKEKEESDLLQSLERHQNVIEYIGTVQTPTCLQIVLEYLPRGSLYGYLTSNKPINTHMLLSLSVGISLGMEHLHNNKIIHRDLAARNILLYQDPTTQELIPKISDFGLSRKDKGNPQDNVTGSNCFPVKCGSPESFLGQYDKRSDVWSFANLIIEMLNQGDPFPNVPNNPIAMGNLAERIRNTGAHPEVPANCPEDIKPLLNHCWKLNLHDRPYFGHISSTLVLVQHKYQKEHMTNNYTEYPQLQFATSPTTYSYKIKEMISTLSIPDRSTFTSIEQFVNAYINNRDEFMELIEWVNEEVVKLSCLQFIHFNSLSHDQIVLLFKFIIILSRHGENRKNYVLKYKIVTNIINIMNFYSHILEVQRYACRTLCILAGGLDDKQNKQQIAYSRGIESIIQAMNNYPNVPSVQLEACGALRNLAFDSQNRKHITKNDGIKVVLQAMKNHPPVLDIQRYACTIIEELAKDSKNRQDIAEKGGIDALIQAMDNDPHVYNVQLAACRALQKLAMDYKNKKIIAEKAGITAIIQAMTLHSQFRSIQEAACRALENLSFEDQNMAPIIEQGGLEAMLQAMKKYPEESDIQRCACGALCNLSVVVQNRKLVLDKGGETAIIQAMRGHRYDVDRIGRDALRNLGSTASEAKGLFQW